MPMMALSTIGSVVTAVLLAKAIRVKLQLGTQAFSSLIPNLIAVFGFLFFFWIGVIVGGSFGGAYGSMLDEKFGDTGIFTSFGIGFGMFVVTTVPTAAVYYLSALAMKYCFGEREP